MAISMDALLIARLREDRRFPGNIEEETIPGSSSATSSSSSIMHCVIFRLSFPITVSCAIKEQMAPLDRPARPEYILVLTNYCFVVSCVCIRYIAFVREGARLVPHTVSTVL